MTAIRKLEEAARELLLGFGGKPGEWTLGGEPVRGVVADCLLSLHGRVLDVDNEWRMQTRPAGSTSTEFRVRWRREGRSSSQAIYQTEVAARGKIDRLLALEEVKGDIARFEDMPDLVGLPTLEVRVCGSWQDAPEPAASRPTHNATASMREWARPEEDDVVPF